jgi:hypothetical protein
MNEREFVKENSAFPNVILRYQRKAIASKNDAVVKVVNPTTLRDIADKSNENTRRNM